MSRTAIAISAIVLVAQSAVATDLVTERWGHQKQCRHAGTVTFTDDAEGGGVVARFDLSALPKGARVHRARLLMVVRPDPAVAIDGFMGLAGRPKMLWEIRQGPGPLAEPILARPLAEAYAGRDRPKLIGEPLELIGPRYIAFDATETVRDWASGKLPNCGWWISKPPHWEKGRTCLEVTYDGDLKDPPPQVTGLKAFHRAGQVFLTFNEVNRPFAGAEEVTWEALSEWQQKLDKGDVPQVSYRIYRHTQPITAASLRQAEMLDDVPQLSGLDERMIRSEWKGEQLKEVRVKAAPVPRVLVEPKKELPLGVGVFVRTTVKAGRFYYAVTAAQDGVENARQFGTGNSLTQPLVETVALPEPILHHETVHVYDKPRPHRFYMLWCDPPLSNVPGFYHMSVTSPSELPKEPVPLFVQGWWWDFGWSNAGARETVSGCVSLSTESPWNLYKGIHEGSGTYKAFDQGTVQDYWLRRFKALLPWLEREHRIDRQRMYAMSADWAWRHADLFAAVHENLCMVPKRSPTYIQAERFFWGPVKSPARTEWGVSAWDYYDAPSVLLAHPEMETPFVYYTPNMHETDMGLIDKPRFYRAIQDSRRPFMASWGARVDAGWTYRIRRDQPLVAFTNCSLDDDPGIGLGGDPGGQINGYLRFDPASAVDRPGRFEMTVWLAGADERGRYGAPVDACTADVTPRRCRQFKPKDGQELAWTCTPEGGGKPVSSGTLRADRFGLVTIEKLPMTKDKCRIVIEAAR